MSPEIRKNGKLVADVPDETGLYRMLDGRPLYVDVTGIEARNKKQVLILGGVAIGGKRLIGLTQEGKGSSSKTKKGGDGKEPTLNVVLHDRPIRVTYSPKVEGTERVVVTGMGILYLGYDRGERRTLHNPRWVRGHGQR